MFIFYILFFFHTSSPILPSSGSPTFSRDVLPIIKEKCGGEKCHSKQRDNPVLTNYKEISEQGNRILRRIKDRNLPMPPRDSGIKMTPGEIAVIETWVKAGMPNN